MPEIMSGSQPGEATQTVLVVDDEELVRNYLTRVLGGAGYQVVVASCGQEALAILASTVVELVITDIRMPGMDGRDLGALVAKLPSAPPVLYASASDLPPAGMESHYIQKPFKGAELILKTQNIIHRAAFGKAQS